MHFRRGWIFHNKGEVPAVWPRFLRSSGKFRKFRHGQIGQVTAGCYNHRHIFDRWVGHRDHQYETTEHEGACREAVDMKLRFHLSHANLSGNSPENRDAPFGEQVSVAVRVLTWRPPY